MLSPHFHWQKGLSESTARVRQSLAGAALAGALGAGLADLLAATI